MKNLLILGAGTAGTMMANKLNRSLNRKVWSITIVDKDEVHYYQPGFLFIPFGIYQPEEVIRPRRDLLPANINFIIDEVSRIDAAGNRVELKGGRTLPYDLLVIATGAKVVPEETPGLKGDLWHKDIFDFYTYEGCTRLAQKLREWKGGRLVINISDPVIKCPVAPLEFAFLADAYFTEKLMRYDVEITFVTPLAGAFTKPRATKMLSSLLKEKHIHVVSDFYVQEVDSKRKVLISYDQKEVPFDLLVTIPVNKGADVVATSGLGDEEGLNFIATDKHTLQSKRFENIFVIGDATNVPASKAGSVAHFEGEIVEENILNYINGLPLDARFDGHANCFIETGFGKAALIDFNYETEPLEGKYPWPVVGPLGLLKVTRTNHFGKLAFRWIYWHILLTGKTLPVSSHMSMAGKNIDKQESTKIEKYENA